MNKEDQKITLSVSSVARFAQDVGIILTVVGVVFGPLWFYNVSQPISNLQKQVKQMQTEMNGRDHKINIIDKNVAVLLERQKSQGITQDRILRHIEKR